MKNKSDLLKLAQTLWKNFKRRFNRFEKNITDILLIVVALVCIFFIVTMQHHYVYDLSIGFLTSISMYYLVVWLPDYRKRKRIKRNLKEAYKLFKEDSIAIYLSCLGQGHTSECMSTLSEPAGFRDYFKKECTSHQDLWQVVADKLEQGIEDESQNDYFNDLVVALEIFMHEIRFTLSAIDIHDEWAFRFLKYMEQTIYRSKNCNKVWYHFKSTMRFLWELHTNYDVANGYSETDRIKEIISLI